ncbi:glutaminase liver isoform, mitochondrial-like isoform X1 [Penaeus japonicus]|uniref:glutaminase liver isoform, mitochondrial-like isoform X1 n=2 Tax=Penaeus japonicus TaxID=27405 RepID=UPI001C70EF98|nr:glutaminase liver isoform, mitochondrial-like isoform X1 [Penaeus japonicus]XP_042868106.1 glutaminase liver isoform, mitochondrial-like isoform X1 [Penaeus japonicus]
MAAQTPNTWITSLVFPSLEVMKTPQPHAGPQHQPLVNGLVNGALRHENQENGLPNGLVNDHEPNLQNNEVADPARNIPFSFPPLVLPGGNSASHEPALAMRPEDSKNLENCISKYDSPQGYDHKLFDKPSYDNDASTDSNKTNESRRIRYLSQSMDTHDYLFGVPEPLEAMMEVREKGEDEEMELMSKKLGDMSTLVREHLVHVENRLFEMFGDKENQTININKFLMGLTATGLRHSDQRLAEMRKNLRKVQEKVTASDLQATIVNYETFMSIISENLEIVVKAFSSAFVIPDFRGFCHHIDEIYNNCRGNTDGKIAHYIPQLERMKPDHWAVSVCTVDGQRYSLGDVNIPFTLQSCSKPLTYAMAVGLYGTQHVHNFMGMEPSGRYFNELCLDFNRKPHNPMINAGAIMTAALLKPELSAADRFDYVFHMYKRLAGGEHLGFNNGVFLSERECADRNFALAYFMRENKCFPENTKLHETLDFYFQLCSLEITAEAGAVMAATLANGGINPLTGDPVLTVEAVRNTLTLMHSCGMYNYSGQFAFKVGLPSKSGVSGCVLLVVPNTMGICLWSPPLDSNGNSCRGVQFCMELVSRFTFHNFDNLRNHITTKTDPRMAKAESRAQILFDLLFSAAAGDLSALRRHSLSGTNMDAKDYDGRTALHVATSEGHIEIVEFLLKNCQVNPLPKDRWNRTPLDDARCFGHPRCGELIIDMCKKRGIEIPPPVSEDLMKD